MCGIFGVMTENPKITSNLEKIVRDLFILSESRGKEASGFSVRNGDTWETKKSNLRAKKAIKTKKFQDYIKPSKAQYSLIGHSRMVTNGDEFLDGNNQPLEDGGFSVVHNGIITNIEQLWDNEKTFKRNLEVDTEYSLKEYKKKYQETKSSLESSASVLNKIEGGNNFCFFHRKENKFCLLTNHGSLYHFFDEKNQIFIFASEFDILKNLQKKNTILVGEIKQLKPNEYLEVTSSSLLKFAASTLKQTETLYPSYLKSKEISIAARVPEFVHFLKRCSKCILPETFPFIQFDQDGICNYCHDHENWKPKGVEALKKDIQPYLKDGDKRCLVAISGGRDSCYGLHEIKNTLGLEPIAYTYDWGFVTPLARRNIARMCSKLGVEHILISANIPEKRRNVRLNVNAWLKNPSLSMIPLFTAGDKQFYYHAEKLKKKTGIDLLLFCDGNRYEQTFFKTGFAGLKEGKTGGTLMNISKMNKLRIFNHYFLQAILNPSYINRSWLDILTGFASAYLYKKNYFHLFHYLPWNEEEIVKTLTEEYNWEKADDTSTTWRIGDSTASFYNYIYLLNSGFTEHDTFRSHQIRSGELSRGKALNYTLEDNLPRLDAIKEYCSIVGVSYQEVMGSLARMKRVEAK